MRLTFVALLVAALTIGVSGQSANDRYAIVKDGKVGFIDFTGTVVIEPEFSNAGDSSHFDNGLAPVSGPRGAGYIDTAGRYVIGPQNEWGWGRPFREGFAGVLLWKHGAALIDRSGRIVLSGPGVREGYSYFSDGLMTMLDKGKFGFVDKQFKWVIPPQYSSANAFSEGRAAVQVEKRWGFIDKNGKVVIPPIYDNVSAFSDGMALVQAGSVFGFVDTQGHEVIPPRFERASSFSEGRAFVRMPGDRVVLIDKMGNIVGESRGENPRPFAEGLAAACLDGLCGYLDRSGLWAISPQFTRADSFRNGLARVAWTGAHGYIDTKGRTVWKSE